MPRLRQGRDRDRAEQQSRPARAAGDVPQPGGADDALAVGGNKESPSAGSRPSRRRCEAFAVAAVAEGFVEQRLARFDVTWPFLA